MPPAMRPVSNPPADFSLTGRPLNVRAHRPPQVHGLSVGIALALTDPWLACGLFSRVHRNAVRTGLLARYRGERSACAL
jgi:hypothetical protein